jgi:hypothetical protein
MQGDADAQLLKRLRSSLTLLAELGSPRGGATGAEPLRGGGGGPERPERCDESPRPVVRQHTPGEFGAFGVLAFLGFQPGVFRFSAGRF